jgi:hypothetical protein
MTATQALVLTGSILIFVLGTFMLTREKIRIFELIKGVFHVFRNGKTDTSEGKFSVLDLLAFIVAPLGIGFAITFCLSFIPSSDFLVAIMSALSTLFAILLGFIGILFGKKGDNGLIQKLLDETMTALLGAMLMALLSFCFFLLIVGGISNVLAVQILSSLGTGLAISCLMFVLLIVKRIYVSFSSTK